MRSDQIDTATPVDPSADRASSRKLTHVNHAGSREGCQRGFGVWSAWHRDLPDYEVVSGTKGQECVAAVAETPTSAYTASSDRGYRRADPAPRRASARRGGKCLRMLGQVCGQSSRQARDRNGPVYTEKIAWPLITSTRTPVKAPAGPIAHRPARPVACPRMTLRARFQPTGIMSTSDVAYRTWGSE